MKLSHEQFIHYANKGNEILSKINVMLDNLEKKHEVASQAKAQV